MNLTVNQLRHFEGQSSPFKINITKYNILFMIEKHFLESISDKFSFYQKYVNYNIICLKWLRNSYSKIPCRYFRKTDNLFLNISYNEIYFLNFEPGIYYPVISELVNKFRLNLSLSYVFKIVTELLFSLFKIRNMPEVVKKFKV